MKWTRRQFGSMAVLPMLFPSKADGKQFAPLTNVLSRYRYRNVPAAARRNDLYLLLDTYNHRMVFTNSQFEEVRQIGQIGQDPGGLVRPFDFSLGTDDSVTILDRDGTRVQTFGWRGDLRNSFESKASISCLALDSHNNLYVSRPTGGHLVEVLDPHGERLRKFGTVPKVSDLYGPGVAEKDRVFGLFAGRGKISVDHSSGEVYVAYESAPFLDKYDGNGELMFRKQLPGEVAQRIVDEFRSKKRTPISHGYYGDGVSLPYVIPGVVFDPDRRQLYIFLQLDRCWVLVVDADGEPVRMLDVEDTHLLLQKPSIDRQNRTLIAAALSSKLGSGIYAMKLDA